MRVTLRTDKLKNGRKGLYLDVYVDKDNQYQKRLKMYLIPEKSESDRLKNLEVRKLAEIIRNKLELDLLKKKHGQSDPREKYNFSFVKYFDSLVEQRFNTGVNYSTWRSVQKHFNNYIKEDVRFEQICKSSRNVYQG